MIAQIHENAPKIALELFVHSCENRNSSVRTADAGEPGKSRMKQKIPHKCARCPVFAGAACLLKMHEKKPRSPSGNPQLPIFLPY